MNKIVVAKFVRLGKDGDNFSKGMIAKEERTNVKVDVDYIKTVNANWKTSGRMYIIDEKATDLRDKEIASKNDPLLKMTRDELKEKADELEIEYPKNIKTRKLIELLNGH